MFSKILIANRGEIAVRIMRTAKKMGIRTVAVYSEADANALHVREADEAIFIGESPSIKSYLNIENLMDAINRSGTDCVHPGYGFLSENGEFARCVQEAGVAWIGPDFDAVRKMGDKIESKKIAKAAGVNGVPGVLEAIKSFEEAQRVVKEIGYPVIIKAAAGGGGKGMRIARNDQQLKDGIEGAAREAMSSFKDARVFIERYFDNPRHIEIQILADKHGNTLWLGERECSIQRRHQKVIEEAPSVFLDEKLRRTMGEQSVALAKQVKYCSAGTVEFIMDQNKNFYFLEMNTRLQVEHRVTELITGIDLVEQMIRVAAGEKLAFGQKDVQFHGWAMETRLYAEDPKRNFLPSTGRITRYLEPENVENVLIDTGIYEGSEISMFYDPMIAKVCTTGETREQTIDAMRDALAAFIIEGIAHNTSFLEAILSHPRFIAGDISTNFIEQEYKEGFTGAERTDEATKVFLGVATTIFLRDAERAAKVSQQVPGRQREIGARWVINIDGNDYPVYVRPDKDKGYFITHNRRLISVRTNWQLGKQLFQGTVNSKPISVQLKHLEEGYRLTYGGASVAARIRTPRSAELAQFMPKIKYDDKKDKLISPIAGLVVSIKAKEGQTVHQGQELMIIEAMKMENVLTADHDTVIKKIHVGEKESVAVDQVLLEFAA